jgi:hypothetical protein
MMSKLQPYSPPDKIQAIPPGEAMGLKAELVSFDDVAAKLHISVAEVGRFVELSRVCRIQGADRKFYLTTNGFEYLKGVIQQ